MIAVFKYISVLIVVLHFGTVRAQVVTVDLFSKMDVSPQYTLWDGNNIMLMGFTELLGSSIDLPSPVIIVNEGDSVDLSLRNFSQPAPHTIHLHGLDVDQQNDGVPHLSFYIPHDSTGHYYFVAPHAGTYLYHCHVVSSLHVQAGMYGMLIVRASDGSNTTWDGGYPYDSENAWLFSEIDTNWHTFSVINDPWNPQDTTQLLLDYNPQYFLINGKSELQLSAPETSINAAVGEVVYMRLANIGYYGNRVIFPNSVNSRIISSDGRPLPVEVSSDTVDIMPGERYGVLIEPTIEMNDVVSIEYFDLNTQQIANTQNAPITIQGFNILEDQQTRKLHLFPNPTNNQLNLVLPNLINDESTLKVIDMTGKLLFSKNISNEAGSVVSISTFDWAEGIYMVQFGAKNQFYTEKFVIKH